MGSFTTAGNYRTADPRLVAIAQAAAARSPYNVVLFSGERSGNSRSQHSGGNAIDIVLIDPQSGREIPNLGAGGEAFTAYESFARTMRETQQQIAPDLSGNFRWGGYFGPSGLNSTGLDLMHFDLGPTQNMALGTWEGGLNERGRTFVAQAGAGQTYSATQGPGSQRPSSTMAYAAPAGTPAGQSAINAAAGPAAGLPAPAPAPGSQRLFRPRSEAIAAREAGGTPRLDELSNIIQQRRAGMNPLLERLQNFIQTRRAARQEDQAPTPPAPIPANAASPAGGGGGSNADPAVTQLQQELAAAGFDPGPIDGLMGPRTRAAMAARDAAGPAMPAAPAGGGLPRPSIMDRTMAGVKGGVSFASMPARPGDGDKAPAPLPNPNIARPGVAAPVMGDGMVNRSYTQPTGQMAPRPVTGDGMVNRQYTMPTGQMPAAPATNPQFAQMLALEEALARQQAGEPQRIAEQDARWQQRDAAVAAAPPAAPARMNWGLPIQPQNPASVPTPSANPTLGPMLAGYQMPPPQAASPGGVLPTPPPMTGPGSGGMPVSTNPTTLVGNTGTPFTREDAVNRGFMPAGRDDFGLQNGFFRDLPGFNAQNPPLVTPQTLGQTALRQPVTTTTPTMPNMPLRGMAIPPWWRQFMGTGV